MSAPLSHEQLAMFMPAHQIKEMTGKKSPDRKHYYLPGSHMANYGLSDARESVDDMWERKAKEAKTRRITSSIKKKGVQKPVKMMPYMGSHILLDGHHRVAAAASLDPNYLVPVEHI